MVLNRFLFAGICAGLFTVGIVILDPGGSRPVTRPQTGLRSHSPIRIHRQRERGQYESTNWSGYAVTGANGSVTDVTASWMVPTVTCSSSPTGYSAFWVGIDGFSSNTVEQVGTDSDCVSLNGRKTDTPTYYAWYEFYPESSYVIQLPRAVAPGDVMVAEVKYLGQSVNSRHGGAAGQFTVTITDTTLGETASVTSSVRGAQESSAEWIAEAPCCTNSGGVLPLADFSSVDFSSPGATVSKSTGNIASFGANVQEITMVGENSSSLVKAQPSGVSGGNFFVNWLNPGP